MAQVKPSHCCVQVISIINSNPNPIGDHLNNNENGWIESGLVVGSVQIGPLQLVGFLKTNVNPLYSVLENLFKKKCVLYPKFWHPEANFFLKYVC